MKIAHIVSTFPPYYGGMGNVVYQTASGLAALGHEVGVFTVQYYEKKEIKRKEAPPAKVHAPELQEQIDYVRRLKPTLRYGNAAFMPRIKKELQDFDLLHLHYPFFGTANLVRRWKLRNPDKPLVITYHMDTRGPGWRGLFFKYYSWYWLPRILSSADKLIASSFDYIKNSDASQIFEQARDRWVELPFGVNIEKFKPREKPEALFNRHNLNPDMPVVLFVGGMDRAHYFKGISVLLRALRILKKREAEIQAVLVGEGKLRENFELEAKMLDLGRLVKFTGKVSDEELPYYYNMADLLVLPSINQGEAFGMVLLEAMASGVPVAASDLPGVRQVAKDGGLVVRPNNQEELAEAIYGFFAEIKQEVQEWKRRVRAAAEEKYAWGPIVKELEGLYQQLTNKQGLC